MYYLLILRDGETSKYSLPDLEIFLVCFIVFIICHKCYTSFTVYRYINITFALIRQTSLLEEKYMYLRTHCPVTGSPTFSSLNPGLQWQAYPPPKFSQSALSSHSDPPPGAHSFISEEVINLLNRYDGTLTKHESDWAKAKWHFYDIL